MFIRTHNCDGDELNSEVYLISVSRSLLLLIALVIVTTFYWAHKRKQTVAPNQS